MGEVETIKGIRREVTIGIAFGRRLDLDHARAKVGQECRCVGPGDERRALDDGDVIQNFDRHEYFSRLIFHGSSSLAMKPTLDIKVRLIFWQAPNRSDNLSQMARTKSAQNAEALSLRPRQRRRPSVVKSKNVSRATPAQNLLRAIKLSEFCLALRNSARPKNH